jgi:copper chaperone
MTNTTVTGTETTENFQVLGMTCDHCARAVTNELMEIAGVSAVRVDVPTGEVTVSSAAPLTTAGVRAAIVEAGYQLA